MTKSFSQIVPALAELAGALSEPTSRAVHGDRYGMTARRVKKVDDLREVYVGFKSLFQGDHLGVEYALSAHQTMLQRSGLLQGSSQMLRHVPFPEGPLWEGLVIDDFFAISCDKVGKPVGDSLSMASLSRAEETYLRHGVFGSDEKTVYGSERFKVIGAEIGADKRCRGAGVVSVSAPVEKRFALAALSLRVAQLPIISREVAARLAGSWISILMFRRPMTCLLHHFFGLGAKSADEAREVVPLTRKHADELVVAAALSPLCFADVSVRYNNRIYATDASLTRGAVVSRAAPEEVVKTLWLGGDRKGGYTKLDSEVRSILRGVGEADDEALHAPEMFESPARTIDFSFDFVEICGGSGVVSKRAAELGLSVCTPIDISRSKHFDLVNLDLLWWILGMIRYGKFKAVCCEPPCTTFSPAQHPSSRSYSRPLGFCRTEPKTLLGNILAFRCLIICWYAARCERPSLLEQSRLSKMAWLRAWQYLLEIGFEEAILASCMFGSPHRKEFRFLIHGLDRDFLDVRCCGGHSHVKIEGKYTKASGVYVAGVADRIARAFVSALSNQQKNADFSSLQGLESVIANDLLLTGGWKKERVWSWKHSGHINVYESYSFVGLLGKLAKEGGDQRFVTLLDSRVAKGAQAKGRSSSNALRCSLQKSCSLQLAGNLHPSLGFAPTRLNTADAPTRFRDFPDVLPPESVKAIHSKQFSRPAAGWIRFYILVSFCLVPSAASPCISSPVLESEFDFGLWIFRSGLEYLNLGFLIGFAALALSDLQNFRPPFGPPKIIVLSWAFGVFGSAAMPLMPATADD